MILGRYLLSVPLIKQMSHPRYPRLRCWNSKDQISLRYIAWTKIQTSTNSSNSSPSFSLEISNRIKIKIAREISILPFADQANKNLETFHSYQIVLTKIHHSRSKFFFDPFYPLIHFLVFLFTFSVILISI